MTVVLWRIATHTREFRADDLQGKGAELTGGRWNRPGRPVVYTATSVALACLETVVHLRAHALPLNRFLVRIDVPDALWADRQVFEAGALPAGWNAVPEGKVSLDLGDTWLKAARTAMLVVPSAIVPEEQNVLLNPRHPQAGSVTATLLRPWVYDQRLT